MNKSNKDDSVDVSADYVKVRVDLMARVHKHNFLNISGENAILVFGEEEIKVE